jgi:hypothetical protein
MYWNRTAWSAEFFDARTQAVAKLGEVVRSL